MNDVYLRLIVSLIIDITMCLRNKVYFYHINHTFFGYMDLYTLRLKFQANKKFKPPCLNNKRTSLGEVLSMNNSVPSRSIHRQMYAPTPQPLQDSAV